MGTVVPLGSPFPTEIIGTSANNLYQTGSDGVSAPAVYYGLAGDDTMTTLVGPNNQFNRMMVGGPGSDVYSLSLALTNTATNMIIMDAGGTGSDTLRLGDTTVPSIGGPLTLSFRVIDGRHLVMKEVLPVAQPLTVIVVDYLQEANKIETIKITGNQLNPVTLIPFTYEATLTSFTINSTPMSWGDVGLDATSMNTMIAQAAARSALLTGG
jgi:Ca2+-binding RTX toxin-like protein